MSPKLSTRREVFGLRSTPWRRRTDRKPRVEPLESRWVPSYTITNVGALGTHGAVPAENGLNNKGALVGFSLVSGAGFQAFEYTHHRLKDLGTLGGPSYANGINDSGTVVGVSLPNSSTGTVFIDRGGKIKELAPFSQSALVSDLYDIAINDHNEVTGFTASNGDDVLLEHGKQVDIGSLDGNGSVGLALNNSGEVVGYSVVSGAGTNNPDIHAFAYSKGKMTDLGTLGGVWSYADGVNAKGEIVGSSDAGNGVQAPFIYEHGRMINLGSLGGTWGIAHAINDHGVIVGTSYTASGAEHAFIDQNGTMTDLNSLIPANSGYVLFRGVAINDKGQILTEAYSASDPTGPDSVLLLTPARSSV